MKVWSSNPDHNGEFDFALVEMTQEFAKLTLRRTEVLHDQKELDAALGEMYFWDSTPEFFCPWADPASQAEEVKAACLKLGEEVDDLQIDRREMVAISADFGVLQSQVARVTCSLNLWFAGAGLP